MTKTFIFDPKAVKKQFILHDRIPNGLPEIMRELARRGKLATPEQIYSGELFGKNTEQVEQKSLVRRVVGGIYSRTFGAVGSYFYSST